MATAYKVLGQSKPTAGTLTTLYTVPSSTQAVISSLTIANMGPTSTTYRVAVRPAGSAISIEDYIAYDVSIPTLDTVTLTIGITLGATDIISVESYSGLVAFNLFGSEIS
jgi:hypothetical protein